MGWRVGRKMSWHPTPKNIYLGIAAICSFQQPIWLQIWIPHSLYPNKPLGGRWRRFLMAGSDGLTLLLDSSMRGFLIFAGFEILLPVFKQITQYLALSPICSSLLCSRVGTGCTLKDREALAVAGFLERRLECVNNAVASFARNSRWE